MEQLLIGNISLTFDRKRSRFSLSVMGETIEQNVCEFILTRSFLVGQNIEEFLMSADSRYDFIKIPLTGTGKTITLSLADFTRLREAYSRQSFLLSLEDMLSHRGVLLSA